MQRCKNSAPNKAHFWNRIFSREKENIIIIFLCWKSNKKGKQKTKSKRSPKMPRKKRKCFWVVGEGWILPKMDFWKHWKTLTLLDDFEKKGFRCTELFWPFSGFGGFQKTKHYKKGSWNGCRKGVSLSVMQKSCALLKTLFWKCFQQNTTIAEKEGCKLHKNRKTTKNSGLSFKLYKECLIGWLVCCMLCFERWLCGVSVLLCSFLALMVLCFCFVYLVPLQMC